jgi:hypothetical protein
MTEFTIVHSYSDQIVCRTEASVYCPDKTAYLVPPRESFINIACSMYEAEKDRSEWIRKYDNVISGLKYWRERALSK